jgi:hypothetical protein
MKPSNNRTYVIYRVGSIGGSKIRNRKPSTLLGAAKHNLREIHLELGPGSCIDSSKSNQNLVLVGSNCAQGIVTQMRNRMLEAGIDSTKLRHDYVQAAEILISLSNDLGEETLAFFNYCVEWLRDWFGNENLVSAIVHFDESQPHLHALVAPVVGRKANGNFLINQPNLKRQKIAFEKAVSSKFGVQMPPEKPSRMIQMAAANCVIQHLIKINSPILRDLARNTILNSIRKDPFQFIADYGLSFDPEVKARSMKTMVQIFTSRGKGKKSRT